MSENISKPMMITIGQHSVDIEEVESAITNLLTEILLPDELAFLKKMKSYLKFDFRNFVSEHNDKFQDIYNDGDFNKMSLPVHKLAGLHNVFQIPDEIENEEEFIRELQEMLPRIAMAIFMYIIDEGEGDIAVGIGKFFKRTIYDFSDRMMEEPPQMITSILDRIDKRINLIITASGGIEVNANNGDELSSVFICASNADSDYVTNLRTHFNSIKSYVEFWDESKIKSGENNDNAVRNAISKSRFLILLLSADFFNSDIYKSEVFSKVLSAAQLNGTVILPVILRPILFEEYPQINQYKTINDLDEPISGISENDREKIWVKLVRTVRDNIKKE